jgi:hypothetical protein
MAGRAAIGAAIAALLAAAPAGAVTPVSPPQKGKAAKPKKPLPPGPVRTRVQTASASGHGAILTATATCPGRTKAISGGFSAPPVRAGGGSLPVVYESQKIGVKAWRASAQLIDITEAEKETASLSTYVYCRKRAPRAVAVAATLHAEPLPVVYGPAPVAACPAPLRAFAGGFTSGPQLPVPLPSNAFVVLPFESVRAGPGLWRSNAVSGTGIDGDITTFAYCSKSKRPPREVTGRGTASTANQTRSTALARCAKGKAISGGFSNLGAGKDTGAFYPYESLRDGRTWRVSGLSQGKGPLTLVAHAYCV